MAESNKKNTRKKVLSVLELNNLDLVEIIRNKGRIKKQRLNDAYNELEKRIKPKIMHIVSQFYIHGYAREDIYQEALYALRYKAIPDYNKNKGNYGPYPFDKFAALCVRRHLSTLLKTSFQNKKRALNTSISLNQDRNVDSKESLFLSDIIPVSNDKNMLDTLENKERYTKLVIGLFKKLSKFEQYVFLLYVQRYSYEQMASILGKSKKIKNDRKQNKIKSIDNALSRIKQKSKEIYQNYDKM